MNATSRPTDRPQVKTKATRPQRRRQERAILRAELLREVAANLPRHGH